MKKGFWAILFTLLLSGCGSEDNDDTRVRYTRITSPNSDADVVMYFWYRCPACYQAEGILSPWAEANGVTVEYRHSHMWESDARLFYTLELLGVAQQHQSELMEYFHYASNPNLADIAGIVNNPDYTEDYLKRRLNSPYVDNLIASAKTYETSVGSSSVPLIIVKNKYAIVGEGLSKAHLEDTLAHLISFSEETREP